MGVELYMTVYVDVLNHVLVSMMVLLVNKGHSGKYHARVDCSNGVICNRNQLIA